ncbi:MAG: SDH family Clp fold serine proteinase [Formosimonas sp.]
MSTSKTKKTTGMAFPRTKDLPTQSAKYWAKEKDRYIRQLLISDIEEITNREIIVYFAAHSEGISHTDADDISEIISGLRNPKKIDLIINTPGGVVDSVEKVISVLQSRVKDYRVIVPNFAKSGGTVIALSAKSIVLGVNSELGPIDPQFNNVPCDVIAKAHNDPIIKELALLAVERMKILASKILKMGMLSALADEEISAVIEKLSSSNSCKSHGAVIDHTEAKELGLNVEWLEPEDKLWEKIWLLHCLYDHDVKIKSIGKIFEGKKNSISRPLRNN